MFKHINECTGRNSIEKTLLYLALQGWYDIHSAIVFNILSAANKQQNTCRAILLCLLQCQDEPFFRPVSQQVHYLRQPHVCRVCSSTTLTLLRDASVDFRISNCGQPFCTQSEEDWGHEVNGLLLGYDHNVLIDTIYNKLRNGLLYYCQAFHCPTSAKCISVQKPYSNLPGSLLALASASKYFQMLPALLEL